MCGAIDERVLVRHFDEERMQQGEGDHCLPACDESCVGDDCD